jgi:hypothetical protein
VLARTDGTESTCTPDTVTHEIRSRHSDLILFSLEMERQGDRIYCKPFLEVKELDGLDIAIKKARCQNRERPKN